MKHDYSQNITNLGPQEVMAVKRGAHRAKKGTARRGKDLRAGK